jgi:hypothetical protein
MGIDRRNAVSCIGNETISSDDEKNKIFKDTKSASSFLSVGSAIIIEQLCN